MKLIIFLTVLTVFGVRGESFYTAHLESLSAKDQFRAYFKHHLKEWLGDDVDELCVYSLSEAQIVFGNEKLAEFVTCGNTTIDTYVDKLNFDLKLSDLSSPTTLRNYIGPLCEVFDDIFSCIRDVEPVIDLCISENERRFKIRLYTIMPLIRQSVCLKNGDLLADLFEHNDGRRCLEDAYEWISDIEFDDIFNDDNVGEFFASERLCSEFNRIRLLAYTRLGLCSTGVLNIIAEMLGHFCEGTKCHRFISDLKC